ncbi:MAG: hypothetical protein A3K59_08915 [Euryarchaeota archaeon RBG_19FT_COMBO_69_17]|nr:MAG: hypothetical protein A3K59_08915 [Euryarchaeota archaeon RBG_19FT_COMBO_69_17]
MAGRPTCREHKLVADVAVLSRGRVLLVRYEDVSGYDGQRGWFLPDDYLKPGEHPDDAAGRILEEQVGRVREAPKLGFIESFGGDGDPWHLIFHYLVRPRRALVPRPNGNVAAAEWFSLRRLPPRDELAHHGWAADALARLLRRSR